MHDLRADTYTTTAEFAAIPKHEAVAFADSGALVAVTGQADDPEARRFAQLFAAAPEMLEALRNLLGMAALVPMAPIEKYHAVVASARAAIAKAEGKQP